MSTPGAVTRRDDRVDGPVRAPRREAGHDVAAGVVDLEDRAPDGAFVTGAGGEPGLQRDAVGVADEHARHGVLVAQQRVGVERVVDQDVADRALGLDELGLLDPAAAAAAARAHDDVAGEVRLVAAVVQAERVADGGGVDDRSRRRGNR